MKILILTILSLLITPTITFADGIKIISEDWPPFSYKEKGVIIGFSIEIIEQIVRDTKIEQEGKMEIWPWARAFREIQEKPNILITGMARSEERENLFKWIGPIGPREIWLFRLASREDIVLRSLEDAKSYKTGVVRKTSGAEQLMKNGFLEKKHLQFVSKESQALRMLLVGRVDFVTFNLVEMVWQLKQMSPPASMKMVKPALLISGDYQYYFGLSKQIPDSIVSELQKALDQMKRDGRYKKIWKKYME